MQRGFTLIEVMLVMGIMALASAIVMFSISSGSQRQAVQLLFQQLKYAQQLSISHQQVFGLQLGVDNGRFLRFTSGHWQPVVDDILTLTELKNDGHWVLVQNSDNIDLKPLEDEHFEPQVIFMSDASFNDFDISLSGEPWRLKGRGMSINIDE